VRAPSDRLVLRVLWRIHRFWWRVSGGRIGARVAGLRVLELTTTGRTSGEPRSVLLNYLEHPGGYIVVASNAGADEPPAWWRNLEATPTARVSVGGKLRDVESTAMAGVERDQAWSAFVAANRGYEEYAAATSRVIPVVLLRDITGAVRPLRPTR